MKVYLDNGATTRPRNEVIEEMTNMLKYEYGNPSSLHRMGLDVEKRVNNSRSVVSRFLKVREDEVFFTSGGTESNNIAVQGIVNKYSKRGNHLITSKIEHPSVLNIFKKFEEEGYDVTYLNVDNNGMVKLDELENSINENTILVSIMLVNNELGTIQPIKKIVEIIKKKNRFTKIHVDAIQGIGKMNFDIKSLNIDTLSFSGHKIHGPKGIGGLYVKKDLILSPIFYGGRQERGIRVGTENVPGIIGLGKAFEMLSKNFNEELEKILSIRNYFLEEVKNKIDNIKINSSKNFCAPHIVSISFKDIRGEVLLHYLENYGIYVSTRSACTSGKKSQSHVLKSIGLNDDDIEGTIRFSFSSFNTKEEIDYALDKMKEAVEDIRNITMR